MENKTIKLFSVRKPEQEFEQNFIFSISGSIINVDFGFGVFWYLILCVRMSSWFAWMHIWSETLKFEPNQQNEFNYVKGTILTFSKMTHMSHSL